MLLEEISGNIRRLPGPKPKPLAQRNYVMPKPIKRIQRSYPRERIIDVLLFLINHRIPRDDNLQHRRSIHSVNEEASQYRAPTLAEASQYLKISVTTIAG